MPAVPMPSCAIPLGSRRRPPCLRALTTIVTFSSFGLTIKGASAYNRGACWPVSPSMADHRRRALPFRSGHHRAAGCAVSLSVSGSSGLFAARAAHFPPPLLPTVQVPSDPASQPELGTGCSLRFIRRIPAAAGPSLDSSHTPHHGRVLVRRRVSGGVPPGSLQGSGAWPPPRR
jgi:hypothetical protein